MEDLMIKIDNVSKQYRLGAIGGGTLRGDLQTWWALKRGREDPNSKIGSKVYAKNEKFMALDGVSFEVKKGERVGIIGHNGAGKSTLLKLLSRVTAPTGGEIKLNGRVASMLEVGTGFHPELTGRENIYMNGAILGMSRKEIDAKIEDIIEFSECRQFIDTPVKRYSSGMYVKLAFSVAAHLDSEIMIMDEVLAVGDMAFQKKCLDKMSEVSKGEGRTILYVSHNMNTIRQLCDRVIVLSHGKVVFDGDVEKGISVYLGGDINDMPAFYDLSKAPRPSKFHGSELRVSAFRFLGKNDACYLRTEQIKFQVTVDAKKTIDDVKMYSVITAGNGDTVGLMQTYSPIMNVVEDNTYSFELCFDASNLAEDTYSFYVDLFSEDGTGRHLSYDQPLVPIRFRLIDDSPVGIRWQAKYFGHTRLNPLIPVYEVENEDYQT